nr:hypothetical protein [uncultured Carboxylicivirga sp.]
MNAKTSYIIVPSCHLILEFYSGDVYLKDVLALKYKSASDINYRSDYSVIMDYRYANIKGGAEELDTYIREINTSKTLKGHRFVGVLTSRPNEVVAATLFDLFNRELPIVSKVFSTTHACIGWLANVNPFLRDCTENFNQLNDLLNKYSIKASQ